MRPWSQHSPSVLSQLTFPGDAIQIQFTCRRFRVLLDGHYCWLLLVRESR